MNNEVSVKQVRIFEKLQVIENQRLGHSELITVVLFFLQVLLKRTSVFPYQEFLYLYTLPRTVQSHPHILQDNIFLSLLRLSDLHDYRPKDNFPLSEAD